MKWGNREKQVLLAKEAETGRTERMAKKDLKAPRETRVTKATEATKEIEENRENKALKENKVIKGLRDNKGLSETKEPKEKRERKGRMVYLSLDRWWKGSAGAWCGLSSGRFRTSTTPSDRFPYSTPTGSCS